MSRTRAPLRGPNREASGSPSSATSTDASNATSSRPSNRRSTSTSSQPSSMPSNSPSTSTSIPPSSRRSTSTSIRPCRSAWAPACRTAAAAAYNAAAAAARRRRRRRCARSASASTERRTPRPCRCQVDEERYGGPRQLQSEGESNGSSESSQKKSSPHPTTIVGRENDQPGLTQSANLKSDAGPASDSTAPRVPQVHSQQIVASAGDPAAPDLATRCGRECRARVS